MFMKLSSIPVVKLPLVDVSTDPLDLLVAGLAVRMKQLARTSPKFIELVHDRAFRIQIGTDLGVLAKLLLIMVTSIQLLDHLKKLTLFCSLQIANKA